MTKQPDDIKKLGEKIADLKRQEAIVRRDRPESEYSHASKVGFRVATELLSAVVVGTAIGYFLDRLLDTAPWMMVLFLLIGGAAGVLNVYRFVKAEENKTKE